MCFSFCFFLSNYLAASVAQCYPAKQTTLFFNHKYNFDFSHNAWWLRRVRFVWEQCLGHTGAHPVGAELQWWH